MAWWNLDWLTPSIRRSRAIKQSVETVVNGGTSTHSARGSSLPLIIQALEEAKVPYVITAHPGVGYVVQGKPNGSESDEDPRLTLPDIRVLEKARELFVGATPDYGYTDVGDELVAYLRGEQDDEETLKRLGYLADDYANARARGKVRK